MDQDVTGDARARVQRNLGIGKGMISRWKSELKLDGKKAFPGKGNLKPQDEEMRNFRWERDILKKAVSIFPENPHRYSDS